MNEPEPLQQVRRTFVRFRGRVLSYFGGCDYFRLASHPRVLAAARRGLTSDGLNVAASRLTTGNHEVYAALEKQLARFFQAQSAVLVNSGYVTNLIAAQALAGHFSHTLIDARAHVSLVDAASWLNCPVIQFAHRSLEDFSAALARCGRGARPIVLTDGMFSRDGSVAPLRAYLRLLPRDGLLLMDDAHGAGTIGSHGRGAAEAEGLARARLVQCVTLSKAFGCYGGAILTEARWRELILERSRMFAGSTPLPPALARAALTALEVFRTTPTLRKRLHANAAFLKGRLRQAGFPLPDAPGPIVGIRLRKPADNAALRQALLTAAIFPTFIQYPGGPGGGYFRFVIASEHTRAQLAQLAEVLRPFASKSDS